MLVGEFQKNEEIPKIIGVGETLSFGIRRGYIVSKKDALNSIEKAIREAEKTAEIKIKKVFLGISGSSLKGEISTGNIIISKADNEVTELDTEKAEEQAIKNLNLQNKKIVGVYPISYKLDGQEVLGQVINNTGTKLEAKYIFATYNNQHLEDLIEIISSLGIEVVDALPSVVANSNITLSKKQKIVGSILADIGYDTTNIAVYENENLISLHTFNIGSNDITNDIALGLKITLEEAEKIKLGDIPTDISKKKLNEIIEARLGDIFELINNHLKKIKRDELLPGGIIWTGGGSKVINLLELSKQNLKLPSTIASTDFFGNTKTKLRDNTWFSVLGLLLSGKEKVYEEGSFMSFFNDFKNTIKNSLKQILP